MMGDLTSKMTNPKGQKAILQENPTNDCLEISCRVVYNIKNQADSCKNLAQIMFLHQVKKRIFSTFEELSSLLLSFLPPNKPRTRKDLLAFCPNRDDTLEGPISRVLEFDIPKT